MNKSSTLHPSRSYKPSLGRFGLTGGLVATLDGSTTSTSHQQTPYQTDHIKQPQRAHQTAAFRPRAHHPQLNAHPHRIKKEHTTKCVYSPDSDETVEHFMFHCPLYDNIRSRLLLAQPNYTQHAMDPLHDCSQQPPTICQP